MFDRAVNQVPKKPRCCADCKREFQYGSQYMGYGGSIICRNRTACVERASKRRKRVTGAAGGAR